MFGVCFFRMCVLRVLCLIRGGNVVCLIVYCMSFIGCLLQCVMVGLCVFCFPHVVFYWWIILFVVCMCSRVVVRVVADWLETWIAILCLSPAKCVSRFLLFRCSYGLMCVCNMCCCFFYYVYVWCVSLSICIGFLLGVLLVVFLCVCVFVHVPCVF